MGARRGAGENGRGRVEGTGGERYVSAGKGLRMPAVHRASAASLGLRSLWEDQRLEGIELGAFLLAQVAVAQLGKHKRFLDRAHGERLVLQP